MKTAHELEPTFTVEVYGHTYTAKVDGDGRITHLACKGRWPMYDVRFTGLYPEVLAAVQSAVDAQREE